MGGTLDQFTLSSRLFKVISSVTGIGKGIDKGKEEEKTSEQVERMISLIADCDLLASSESVLAEYGASIPIAPRRNFFFSSGEELELIICGNGNDESKYDFELLKKSCRYQDGYTKDSQTVIDFWSIVIDELTFKQKKQLLSFITGSDRVPIRGLSDLTITISRNGSNDQKLPTSHTCFDHILLPQYSSKDILRERLLVAIENSQGFGLL